MPDASVLTHSSTDLAEYSQPLGFCDQVVRNTCGLRSAILFG